VVSMHVCHHFVHVECMLEVLEQSTVGTGDCVLCRRFPRQGEVFIYLSNCVGGGYVGDSDDGGWSLFVLVTDTELVGMMDEMRWRGVLEPLFHHRYGGTTAGVRELPLCEITRRLETDGMVDQEWNVVENPRLEYGRKFE